MRHRPGGRGLIAALFFAAAAFLVASSAAPVLAQDAGEADDDVTSPWYAIADDGTPVVNLYFVYSSTCPHCQAAVPFVEALEEENAWLRVAWLQADSGDPNVAEVALGVAAVLDQPITGVPTFMFCETMLVGYDSPDGLGAQLAGSLEGCAAEWAATVAAADATEPPDGPADGAAGSTEDDDTLSLPILGRIDADQLSLPVFTVTVAALDAFNPCAFFVLLFLLSLLVHARSRAKMAIIGGVFVLISGVVYFAFMAAWLNVFLVFGPIRWITIAAGAIAVGLAAVNIKDYFSPGQGPSLSIPDSAKPGLFRRMRSLTAGDRWPALLAGTATLAIAANSYELLCTAGFPMVFTRVLTLNDLPTATYYLYLVAYNVVYVIPLLAIVGGFVWALGSRKLQEREGRTLKLLSGTMMLGLGTILLVAPGLLENMATGVLVLAAAVAVTALVAVVDRMRLRRRTPAHS